MEDPTNQYNSGHGVPLEAAPTEPVLSATLGNTAAIAGLKPPRALDEAAWIVGCEAAHPWLPLTRIAAGKGSPLLWGGCRLNAETAEHAENNRVVSADCASSASIVVLAGVFRVFVLSWPTTPGTMLFAA
jgi:hypothetical protein